MKYLSKLALAGGLLAVLALSAGAAQAPSPAPAAVKTPADLAALFQPRPQPASCSATCPNGTVITCLSSSCHTISVGSGGVAIVCGRDVITCPV
jgi:hypothetical protein